MMEVMDEMSLEEELEEADKVGGLPTLLLNQEHFRRDMSLLPLFQGTSIEDPLAPCWYGSWRRSWLSSCGN